MTVLAAFVAAHATFFTVLLAWPPFTAALTALFQRPSTAEILAAVGSRRLALSAWNKALYLCAAVGIDSRSVVAWLRSALTPKVKPPPPTAGIPVYVDEDATSVRPPTALRLATFAAVLAAWLITGAALGCGTFASDADYVPTPTQELGLATYGDEQEQCINTDASHADKVACVRRVRCAHGRAEAGTCDAGNPAHASYVDAMFSISDGGDR